MRKIIFAPGEYYHIYNRGTDKRKIFSNNTDRHRFLKLLYLCNGKEPFHSADLIKGKEFEFNRGENLVEIAAYCLMGNHFHLLLKETRGKGVSTFMHKLGIAYTMYFNKLNERKGSLFETNFSAQHLDSDEYLKYVFAYVHLNPVKIIDKDWKENGLGNLKKVRNFINQYKFSSYLDYLGLSREENCIINQKSLPEYFENKKEIEDYMNDWLTYSPRDLVSWENAYRIL